MDNEIAVIEEMVDSVLNEESTPFNRNYLRRLAMMIEEKRNLWGRNENLRDS